MLSSWKKKRAEESNPPSRLIRTLFLINSALQAKDAGEARNLALHILNDTDLPKGTKRPGSPRRWRDDWVEHWAKIQDSRPDVFTRLPSVAGSFNTLFLVAP